MTAVPAYNRIFSFTNFQTANPAEPLPGNEVDAELNAVKVTTDALISNLSLIQRSDGQVANGVIGPQQLAAGILTGIDPPTQWSGSSVSYDVGATVFSGLLFYVCNTANVSSAGAPPSGNMNWTFLADFSGVTVPPGSITSAAFAAGAVNSAALGPGLSLLATPTEGDNTTAIATTAFVTTAVADIAGIVPYGVPLPFAGASAPSGWHLCDGSAVSRTGNPNLFSAIGTVWGSGDGSTTFNLPAFGSAAMVGVGGSESITLAESVGAASVTLTVGNLASHTHTDSGHTHGVTDPTHDHTATDSGHVHPNSSVQLGGTDLGGGANYNKEGANTAVGVADITVAAAATGVTVNSSTANLENTGSATPFSLFQPSVGVNFIIRAG